jgi:hypothetical protein
MQRGFRGDTMHVLVTGATVKVGRPPVERPTESAWTVHMPAQVPRRVWYPG